MSANRFSGPIEEIIGRTCPGASYCGIDRCFRDGKTCGNDSNCCLTRSQASDLVVALGCRSGQFTSSDNKFSTLSEDPTALDKCSTQLTLSQSDVDFMCKDTTPDICFEKMCNLGCSSPSCPKPSVSGINLQNSLCQTIQQYCDVLDPSLLSDPNYKKLCCEIDPIAGVLNRTVCGCPENPCVSNPVVMKNVRELKESAEIYWKNNPIVSAPVIPSQPESIPVVQPAVEKSSAISIKKYLILIILIILLLAGGFFFYKKKTYSSTPSYIISPSDYPLG